MGLALAASLKAGGAGSFRGERESCKGNSLSLLPIVPYLTFRGSVRAHAQSESAL